MKSFAAKKRAAFWGASLLSHAQPMRHPRLTMILLALDVVLGISVLDALFAMDIHTDAALDLAEAGFLSIRTHQGCGVENLAKPSKPLIAG